MSNIKPLYQHLAGIVGSYHRCIESRNDFAAEHARNLNDAAKNLLPSGGGFDNGTCLDLDRSTDEKLVFATAFHHMNSDGYYDGWTSHTIFVRASLIGGINIHINGPNRNDIKDYIHESFDIALQADTDWTVDGLVRPSAVQP